MKFLLRSHSPPLLLFYAAITLGFSCMVYELALAQTLSLILGQTTLRYPMTIGLYTAALGFGSLFYEKIHSNISSSVIKLVKIEINIALFACFSFFFLFLLDYVFKLNQLTFLLSYESTLFNILSHGLVFIIGFLSGAELPLLMKISEEHKILTPLRLLTADYFGTLAAAVLFPLLLLPSMHLFSIIVLATILNLSSAVVMMFFFTSEFSLKNKIFYFLWPLLGIAILLSLEGIV